MIDDEPDLEPDVELAARPRGPARRMLTQLDRRLNRISRGKGGNFGGGLIKFALFCVIILPLLWVGIYRFADAPETILMAQRALEGETITHRPVSLDRISPHLVRAVIAAEDARFCQHRGFDMEAIDAAMKSNKRGTGKTKLRGGSTISQQTAKNLFLWPHRDWVRKGAETYFTVLSEFMWPKRQIMEQYLNAVEWGDGEFGAEAASQAHFNKSARDLNSSEAARLAAVLPSPNKWSIDRPGPYVRSRAASIEARMWVLYDQKLDLCVLSASAAPPPKPVGKLPPAELPPMPEPPPSIVAEDQPVAQAGPDPDAVTDDSAPVSPEAPEEPEQPADAPGTGKHAPAPGPVASTPDGSGPLNIAP
jgi:monofunctional glycosyltransferase